MTLFPSNRKNAASSALQYSVCFSERITEAEIRRTFKYMDSDSNGKLELEELSKTCEEIMVTTFSNAKINELFKNADANGDGFSDLEEFKKQMKD